MLLKAASKVTLKHYFITIFYMTAIYTSAAFAFDETQITSNMIDDSHVDMAIDPEGKVHLVYHRASQIYHWASETVSGTTGIEEMVTNGTDPSIAIGPSGDLHVSYMDGGNVNYIRKTGSIWSGPLLVAGGSQHNDISVDSMNRAHFVYDGTGPDTTGISILYRYYTGVFFSQEQDVLWGHFDGWGELWYGSEYSNPAIVLDRDDNYHITAEETFRWLNLSEDIDDLTYNIKYVNAQTAPSGERIVSALSRNERNLSNNPITLDLNNTLYIAYREDNSIYVRQKKGTSWKLIDSKTGRNGAIRTAPTGNHVGVAYIDGSSVHYMENNVNSGAISSGSGPALSFGDVTFIAYAKKTGVDKEILLASGIMEGAPLINPIGDDTAPEKRAYLGPKPILYRGTERLDGFCKKGRMEWS